MSARQHAIIRVLVWVYFAAWIWGLVAFLQTELGWITKALLGLILMIGSPDLGPLFWNYSKYLDSIRKEKTGEDD
jgi:hypothetical protein